MAMRFLTHVCAMVLVVSGMVSMVLAADADPIFDFNITGKNPQDAANTDFLFMGLRGAFQSHPMMGELQAAFANRNTFAALDTQGISFAVLKLGPNGQNAPHEHPRATEVLFLIKGVLEVGFVDTKGTVFRNTLYPGDITVFPRGLPHFQLNKGKETALAVAALNSANPGAIFLDKALASLTASN
eukprot:TRINITY_DN23_c0_g1_i2.p1 TRINITY_DN23_c0_g1~~TRINITY_DN23_c0_g1_i2.p1  ORF type:complete len:185 (-),score=39.87 TRINITY_DN23_c0_g1_i2:469-1023(-)